MSAVSDEYSAIGNPEGVLEGIDVNMARAVDPVQMCLPGKFLNAAPLSNFVTNNCPKFMVQRCANNWDKYCNIYINENLKGNSENEQMSKDQDLFMEQVVDYKFCRINPEMNGSQNCKIMQELFDPTLPNSPIIESQVGTIVYTTAPLSGYMDQLGCAHKCDKIDLNTIEKEPLFQRCLEMPNKDPYRSVIDMTCKMAADSSFSLKGDKIKSLCAQRYANLDIFKNTVNKDLKTLKGSASRNLKSLSKLSNGEQSNNTRNMISLLVVAGIIGAIIAINRQR